MNFAGLSSSLAVLAALTAISVAFAQKNALSTPPTAPLPPQLQTASTVFLSSLCTADQKSCTDIYNQLYAGLQAQGKYTLVSSPANADLVFEIHYATRITDVTGSSSSGPVSLDTTTLQLVLLDRATRTALWTIAEPVVRKQRVSDKILADLQQLLTAQAAPISPQAVPRSAPAPTNAREAR